MEDYLRPCFTELLKEDGLVVVARGLGVEFLVAKFVQLFVEQDDSRHRGLVLVINAHGVEDNIRTCLLHDGCRPDQLPKIINNEVTSQERSDIYEEGSCCFITSRILIVDLLDGTLDAMKITGLLIYDAHRISETSIESFIIRAYRENNRTGFIKAFSEDPEALSAGFGKIERLLRTLYLTKLYLWPRFRLEITRALELHVQPEVIETSLVLTPHMKAIQSAILVCMNTCLTELKKTCPQLETSQLTLENGLFAHFDWQLRTQLDVDWHRIPYKAKQMLSDLTTLRKLLDYLVRYDAFAFFYLLLKLQMTSQEQTAPSMWLTTEAANRIYTYAKQRVYQLVPKAQSRVLHTTRSDLRQWTQRAMQTLRLDAIVEPAQEAPPKWAVLQDTLRTIRQHYLDHNTASSSSSVRTAGRVLLIVRDELAASQLRDLLLYGAPAMLDNRLRWFLAQHCAALRRRTQRQRQSQPPPQPSQSHRGRAPASSSSSSATAAALPHPLQSDRAVHDLLSTAEAAIPTPIQPAARSTSADSPTTGYLGLQLEERELRSLSAESQSLLLYEHIMRHTPPTITHNQRSSSSASAQPRSTSKRKRSTGGANQTATDSGPANKTQRVSLEGSSVTVIDVDGNHAGQPADTSFALEESDEEDEEDVEVRALDLGDDLLIHIATHHTLSTQSCFLREVNPQFIILYDAEVRIVRQIEAWQSTQSERVRVYFFNYQGSTEEHRYVTSLAKEKKAFESLILTKEHLVVALPDHPADLLREKAIDAASTVSDSRELGLTAVSGGKRNSALGVSSTKKALVVDVREFRSALPGLLYTTQRWKLLPRTLYVGDYILSPELCVERKGISDLFQSFASGRLYSQVETMRRYYRHACLLIEFAGDKAFSLCAPQDLGPDISINAITSKMVLLTQAFPELRILWARSPQQTCDIFSTISQGHSEADAEKAVSVGSVLDDKDRGELDEFTDDRGDVEDAEDRMMAPSTAPTISSSATGSRTNRQRSGKGELSHTAQEVLLSLPGITSTNVRSVLKGVKSLYHLSTMTESELEPLIGPINAKKLRTFFTMSAL